MKIVQGADLAWIAWGPLQAIGMLSMGYACSAASIALFAAVPGDPSALWRLALGWIGWVVLAKKSAAAGWWRIQGAWILGGAAVAIATLAFAGGAVASTLVWLVAAGFVCLWPWARANAIEAAELAGDSMPPSKR